MNKKRIKKVIIICIAFILIGGLGYGGWYYYNVFNYIYIVQHSDENELKEHPEEYKETEQTIITSYGDEFLVKNQRIPSLMDPQYKHTVFYKGEQVAFYTTEDNPEAEIVEYYHKNGITAYYIANHVYYRGKTNTNFVELGNTYNEEVKPILYELLKDGDIKLVHSLSENKDEYAIKTIKGYAKGDFSNSNFNSESDTYKKRIQSRAKDELEYYGIK
ncbi:hypothetical protein AGMMS50284_7460 [Clostridia bacterium]|nr:hypothetical protein AGMMS50284_7460 [Clostridia bacterium]